MDPEELEAALDATFGPVPADLVEERPELDDPDALNEALKHRYQAPGLFHGLG